RSIHPHDDAESFLRAVFGHCVHASLASAAIQRRGNTFYAERLFPGQTQASRVLPRLELQWQDTHSDEIRPMTALEALGTHRLNAQEHHTFSRPIARRP